MKKSLLNPLHWLFTISMVILFFSFSLQIAYGHGDENAAGDSHFELFHYGSLGFPAWTYYVEIVEHIAMFLAVMIGAMIVYLKAYKREASKSFGLVIFGFVLLALAEALTIMHHFLIHPLGIFNAVVNHFLTLAGFVLLAYGVFMVIKNKNV